MLRAKTYVTATLLLATLAIVASCSQQKEKETAQPAQPPAAPPPAQLAAPAASAIQTQDTNSPGVVADFMECKRKEGVLTIEIKFRNTSNARATHQIYDRREYEEYYVTAANKKYFPLKDSEGTYLATQADGFGTARADLGPGQTYLWWAKYPAPPQEVKKIQFTMPRVAPFDDIAITDQ
jgi:hypothetical protein